MFQDKLKVFSTDDLLIQLKLIQEELELRKVDYNKELKSNILSTLKSDKFSDWYDNFLDDKENPHRIVQISKLFKVK